MARQRRGPGLKKGTDVRNAARHSKHPALEIPSQTGHYLFKRPTALFRMVDVIFVPHLVFLHTQSKIFVLSLRNYEPVDGCSFSCFFCACRSWWGWFALGADLYASMHSV